MVSLGTLSERSPGKETSTRGVETPVYEEVVGVVGVGQPSKEPVTQGRSPLTTPGRDTSAEVPEVPWDEREVKSSGVVKIVKVVEAKWDGRDAVTKGLGDEGWSVAEEVVVEVKG